MKAFYIKYFNILNKVIKEAKKTLFNTLIVKSDNIKATWNIIKSRLEKYI
jgi:hypothetical protein